MSLARSLSVAVVGVTAHVVEVEVDVSTGLPGFTLSALGDRVQRHLEHRIRSGIGNAGENWPRHKVTVAMSPATVPTTGSGFDLPVAATLLAASGELPPDKLDRLVLIGELALSGKVKPVHGILPAVIGAFRQGHRRFVVPKRNAAEARLVDGATVFAVSSFVQLCAWLRDEIDDDELLRTDGDESPDPEPDVADLADVLGQDLGRKAMEIAAAGGHHVLLSGQPGVGKTMLAERLPGILPDLTQDEALEVTGIHSVAGRLRAGSPLINRAPFCAPHHSATLPSIVGGGSGIAQPGAVSLAHRGVLFLDEAPEFSPRVLDALRQPLESAEVTLARAGGIAYYPARFLLVLAANPCPCSAGGRDLHNHGCSCAAATRMRYHSRLSGPLRDRVDIVVDLEPISRLVLVEGARGESSASVRRRVEEARARARRRLEGTPWRVSGEVPGPALRRRWPVPAAALGPVREAVSRQKLSTRGVDRVLKVAWTLADLAGRDLPGADEVQAALSLRRGNRAAGGLAASA